MMKLSLSRLLSCSSPQSSAAYKKKSFSSVSSSLLLNAPPPPPPSPDDDYSLYRRISRIGDPSISVVPVLDNWIQQKKFVEKADLQRIIKELKFYKRFKHALEISHWMTDKRYFPISLDDIASRLHLIFKVHGLEQAEKYFNDTPQHMKGYVVYTSLLNSYCHAKSVEKAECVMQKLRDIGYNQTLAYNILMKLYYSLGNWERLDNMMKEMEEKGINFDMYTYTIRISAHAAASNIEGIDKIVKMMESNSRIHMESSAYGAVASGYLKVGSVEKALEMLKKMERLIIKSKRMNVAFDLLIRLYAGTGKKNELYRIWNSYQRKMKILNKDYISMIGSLVKLDDIEGAEKIFEEWESRRGLSYDFRIPDFLIEAYCRRAELGKAEDDQFPKAVEALKTSISVCPLNWKPSKDALVTCLEILERRGDMEEAEAEEFIQLLKVEGFFSEIVQDKLLNLVKDGQLQS
ncbi:hypothetical protein LguiB_004990 [Lonicera macranthoides]